jgi:hypothetical protein
VFIVFVSVFFYFSVVVLGFFFYVVACVALLVGSCTITYVIFAALVIGFGLCCVIDLVFFQFGLEVFQSYNFK